MKTIEDCNIAERVSGLIKRGFVSTVFQPIVESSTGRPIGFEALLRGPKGTELECPATVFSVIKGDLLYSLDIACIGSAVRNARHLAAGHKIFINIHWFTLQELVNRLDGFLCLLEGLGIDPNRIIFEISECTEPDNVRAIVGHINELKRYGIQIALDDVGVCYAGLHHMMCIEPNFVKLDRSFIHDINYDYRKKDMVEGICYVAAKMNSSLVAEGIENEYEWNALKSIGVPLLQGYLFGHPLPVKKWKEIIDTQQSALETETNRTVLSEGLRYG